MGGFGTWEYARLYPERFAAVVPIAGDIYTSIKRSLKIFVNQGFTIWAFHGDKDETVPLYIREYGQRP